MESQPTRRPGEIVFTILMLLLSIFLLWNAYTISGFSSKSSPGAFPIAATAVMVVAGVFAIVQTLRTPAGATGFVAFRTHIIPNIVLLFGGLILAYGLVLETVGFIITSFVFLFVGMTLLYKRGVVPALFYSILSLILVYVTFRLIFKVVLPEGLIPERRILADLGSFFASLLGGR
jgi:putative tricarboxylic transport membrane protein